MVSVVVMLELGGQLLDGWVGSTESKEGHCGPNVEQFQFEPVSASETLQFQRERETKLLIKYLLQQRLVKPTDFVDTELQKSTRRGH